MTTISRRGVLAGIGATTGAVAFGTLAGTAAAQSDGSGGFGTSGTLEPQLSTAVLPPQQPGLTYIPIDPTAFFVYNETTNGRLVTAASGTTVVANGAGLMAPLPVPVGATIKELVLTYILPAGALAVSFFRKDLLGPYALAPSAPASVPLTSGAGVQTTTVAVNEKVDGKASYMVLVDLMQTTQFINGLLVGYLPPPQSFISLPAILRVLDTRTTGGKLQPNEERVVDLQVPPFARAAVINLTVTETEGAGFVAVFPANVPYPGNSSINWSASNENIANGVITGIDTANGTATGKVKIRGGVNPTHVVIDTQGYLI